jgi:cytoskeletal protein RodZ
MSLINDALKRASQSDRNRPRPTETHAAMRPADDQRGSSLSLVLGIGIVLALGLAGWFFGQWWHASHPSTPAQVETVAAVAPKSAPAPAPVLPEVVPPPKVAAPIPAPAPAPEPAPAPPAKPVVAAWPVDLKLMGIFFSKTNPRAIINGKTLNVGDEIDGIRVTKIEHDQVTVEWSGQVKELIIE